MNKVPELLTNYTVYLEGVERIGSSDIELPSLEAMTNTTTGAGIAGEFDSPIAGHYAAMKAKLNFRTLDVPVFRLATQKHHNMVFRGSQQVLQLSDGTWHHQAVKVTIRGIPIVNELGKWEVASTTDSAVELSVSYIKVEIDGVKVLELDIFNFIAEVNGVDPLAKVRENLGME